MSTDCRWNTDSSSLEYNRVAPSAIASTSTSYFSSEPGIGRLSFSQLCEVSMDYQGKPAIRTFDRDLLVFTARPQNTSFIYPYRAPGRGYLPVLPWTSREGDVESSTRNSKSNKQLPDCKICGEKSVGCHYGVYVCVACKVRHYLVYHFLAFFFTYEIRC